MSQEDSGVHSDGSYPASERKHSTPVTAKELKVTWNYCFKAKNKELNKENKELKVITWNYCFEDKNQDFLVEQEKSTEKERKGRRRSNHLCSNLGRRRRSSNEGLRRRKDDGGVGRRNKDGRRGRRSKDESESHKVIRPLAWLKSSKARIVINRYKIHTHQQIPHHQKNHPSS